MAARRGLSLIELMIALTITMIMMSAVVTLFGNLTTSVSDSRAVIETNDRLRKVRDQLQLDLQWHTAPTIPPLDPALGLGYLEIVEGPNTDIYGTVIPTNSPATTITYNSLAPRPGNTVAVTGWTAPGANLTTNNIMGDCDDVLALTVKSRGAPFVGRVGTTGGGAPVTIESNTAEVIWFAVPNGRTIPAPAVTTVVTPTAGIMASAQPIQLYTLYRRALLIQPQYNLQGVASFPSPYFNTYDVSARYDLYSGTILGNTLGDLTKRENRFYHGTIGSNSANLPTGFPFYFQTASLPNAIFSGNRLGEDVILENVLAFDIQVFDPLVAKTYAPQTSPVPANAVVVGPDDPGYKPPANDNSTSLVSGMGEFVDLGFCDIRSFLVPQVAFHAPSSSSFWKISANASTTPSRSYWSGSTTNPFSPVIFDTWSTHYESNGYDEDGSGVADQGTDGLDNAAGPGGVYTAIDGVIDNPPTIINTTTNYATQPGERETLAPFPVPLRGVQIRIRVYEPDSRQVRQVSVTQDFLPE